MEEIAVIPSEVRESPPRRATEHKRGILVFLILAQDPSRLKPVGMTKL
jgi:hypothetical protein